MAGIISPISRVALALKMRTEGLGLRATGRVLGADKNTISKWESLFANQKETLFLYLRCSQFIDLVFEGDELYTIVNKRGEPSHSEGWTAVIMERGSRFILDQCCGKKDQELFTGVMQKVARCIEKSKSICFFSDGERRYGNTLFTLCAEALTTGNPGRPQRVLPAGVRVRVKNKGSQKHKRGPKRPKYQATQNEHPDTSQDINNADIHANHQEGQNAAIRRRNSAFRRRANTYAKTIKGLQRTLDLHAIVHNFVRKHWTTGCVPAVALGICAGAFSIEGILMKRYVA